MQNEPDIKTKVLEKIRSGKVHIRPKAYFVAQFILITLLSFVALALAVFVLSFVIFSLRESGEQFLLGFGERGVLTFFILFPWTTLIIDILLFLAIEWLIRYFKFGYRMPILRVFLGVIVLAFLGSIIVNLTPLHKMLLDRADRGVLPLLGEWYETIHDSHAKQGVFRGTIFSIQGNNFVISHNDNDLDADDGTWTVTAPLGFNMTNIHVGDKVYVAGNAAQGTVQAYGIQILAGGR